jgi:hypothetical protein
MLGDLCQWFRGRLDKKQANRAISGELRQTDRITERAQSDMTGKDPRERNLALNNGEVPCL